ncbi:VRR-NUC domain-containing protein [bacterium]|nr:VRR-NUC domain-containing protein [bacterium]
MSQEVWTPEQYRAYQRGGEINMPGPDAAETLWQAKVEQLFESQGWLCYHVTDSRKTKAGFPDLVAVHPVHGLIIAELKTKRRIVTEEQEEWLNRLWGAATRVYLWRFPDDWSEAESVALGLI